jgi:hypothetical protein
LIGYELTILGGKDLLDAGISVDTDLYPIYGSPYEEIAAEIFHDGIRLLRQALDGKILYSLSPKVSIIAIPAGTDKYSVKRDHKRLLGIHSSSTKDIPAREVADMDLRILK